MRGVGFEEWIDALAATAESRNVEAEKNPAVKLLEFYRRAAEEGRDEGKKMARCLDTAKAEEGSVTLRALRTEGSVEEWMGRWMGQWGLTEG